MYLMAGIKKTWYWVDVNAQDKFSVHEDITACSLGGGGERAYISVLSPLNHRISEHEQ